MEYFSCLLQMRNKVQKHINLLHWRERQSLRPTPESQDLEASSGSIQTIFLLKGLPSKAQRKITLSILEEGKEDPTVPQREKRGFCKCREVSLKMKLPFSKCFTLVNCSAPLCSSRGVLIQAVLLYYKHDTHFSTLQRVT